MRRNVNHFLLILISITMFFTSCAVKKELVEKNETIQLVSDSINDKILMFAGKDDARLAGSEDEKEAAFRMSEEFKKPGFSVETLSFNISRFLVNSVSIELEPDTGKIPAFPLIYSGAAKEGVQARLIYCGFGAKSDYEKAVAKIKNKDENFQYVALVRRGQITMREKIIAAGSAGAVAVVIFDPEKEEFMGTLISAVSTPGIAIPGSEGLKLEKALVEGQEIEAKVICDVSVDLGTSQNVEATIPGLDRSRFFIIGAHLDSVYTPGADDNASGLASLLLLAEAFKASPPPIDIKLVAFGSEEIGLKGSVNYIYKGKAVNATGMISVDCVGVGDELSIYTSNGIANDLARAIMQSAEANGIKAKYGSSTGSDHYPFSQAGIPSVLIMREPEEILHTDSDIPDRVEAKKIEQTVLIIMNALNTLVQKK